MAKRMMVEEKRQAMLDIFDRTKTFYKLQELEKIGSKGGIVENTIKDVITSLLDDDLISGDKIGISNYYWGNHNKKKHSKMIKLASMAEEANKLEENIHKLKLELKRELELKPMSEEKQTLLMDLQNLERQIEDQSQKLKGYTTLSPEEIENFNKEKESLIKEINELTDNIFVLQSYVCDRFNMEKKDFNNTFNVSQDMDYVE